MVILIRNLAASATRRCCIHTHITHTTQDTTPHFTHIKTNTIPTHPRDTPTHTAASRSLSPPLLAVVVGGVVSIPPFHICSHSHTPTHIITSHSTHRRIVETRVRFHLHTHTQGVMHPRPTRAAAALATGVLLLVAVSVHGFVVPTTPITSSSSSSSSRRGFLQQPHTSSSSFVTSPSTSTSTRLYARVSQKKQENNDETEGEQGLPKVLGVDGEEIPKLTRQQEEVCMNR